MMICPSTAVIDLVDDTSHGGGFSASAGPVIRTIPLMDQLLPITAGGMCQILRIRQIKCNNTDDSGKGPLLPVCVTRNLEETRDSHGKVISSPVSSIGSIFDREQACK